MAYQMSKMKPKQSIRQSKTSKLCFRIFITTILVLTAIISSVKTATCSSSVPSSAATTTEQCSFDGYSITYTYGVVGGPVSKSLYYLYCLSSSSESVAVRKVDASGSQTWMASFPFYPILKSLSVDAAEQSVYLASWTSILMVLKLSSSDGSVVSQHQL